MRRATLALLAAMSAALALAPAADAAPFRLGLSDGLYASGNAAERNLWLNRTVEAGAGIVRVNVAWRGVVGEEPSDPRDPADPAYDFTYVDDAVRGAAAHSLDVMFTVYSAPDFAEGPNRRPDAQPGAWKPRADDYGDFGRALATRYSGHYDPGPGPALPRVRYYEAWNEENLGGYLTPQHENGKDVGVKIYRELLDAFYTQVHAANPGNVVISGGLGPFGDGNGPRFRPVAFLRELFCLEGRTALVPKPCPPVRLDALAHHPISLTKPTQSAISPDDASTPDLDRIERVLRAAERGGQITPAGRHPIWVTEFWWISQPPHSEVSVPLMKQARYIEQSLYLFWKGGAEVAINLVLRDLPSFRSGLFFPNGNRKPSYTAFHFPFVTERLSKRKIEAWGIAPADGELTIQQRSGRRWKEVGSVDAGEREVFAQRLRLRGKVKLRARIAGETSLTWKQR